MSKEKMKEKINEMFKHKSNESEKEKEPPVNAITEMLKKIKIL